MVNDTILKFGHDFGIKVIVCALWSPISQQEVLMFPVSATGSDPGRDRVTSRGPTSDLRCVSVTVGQGVFEFTRSFSGSFSSDVWSETRDVKHPYQSTGRVGCESERRLRLLHRRFS